MSPRALKARLTTIFIVVLKPAGVFAVYPGNSRNLPTKFANYRVAMRGSVAGKTAVLDGFGDVRGSNRRAVAQIGDGAGDFQNPVPGTR